MTDKTQILDEIEELLDSEGSRELAEAMFAVLREAGYLTFNSVDGFALNLPDWNDDGQQWCALLTLADQRVSGGVADNA